MISPRRVLHIGKFYPPERGGMETHVSALCESLSSHCNISVLVANRGRTTVREWINGVSVVRAGTAFELASAPVCPTMPLLIRRSLPELVHLHVPNPGAVLAVIASGYRGPLIVSYHSDVVRQRVLNIAFQPIMDRLLARSAAIVATSPAYIRASPILSRFVDRCCTIPWGIDVSGIVCATANAVRAVRARYPGPLVLSVGRLVYYKGFEYLIRAMQNVNANLMLVGSGPLQRKLQQLAADCGVAGRVHFPGKVEDVAVCYQAADVFVLPSTTPAEAFGIVQLEAMACGKPVVNTDLPTTVPFVSLHGITGLTVPPRDPSNLAAAINLLLHNKDLRTQFGRAARRRVEQEFTVAKMTHRMVELYREVLGDRVLVASN